jgi:hypothetical protein
MRTFFNSSFAVSAVLACVVMIGGKLPPRLSQGSIASLAGMRAQIHRRI